MTRVPVGVFIIITTATAQATSCRHYSTRHPFICGVFLWCHRMKALVDEFNPELTKKEGKLDSDPHLWMPVRETLCCQGSCGQNSINSSGGGGHGSSTVALILYAVLFRQAVR